MIEVISYPRTGSTYVQRILWAYLNDTNDHKRYNERQIEPFNKDVDPTLVDSIKNSKDTWVVKNHVFHYDNVHHEFLKNEWEPIVEEKVYCVRQDHFKCAISYCVAIILDRYLWNLHEYEELEPFYIDESFFMKEYNNIVSWHNRILKEAHEYVDKIVCYESLSLDPATDYMMIMNHAWGEELPRWQTSTIKTPLDYPTIVQNYEDLEKKVKKNVSG